MLNDQKESKDIPIETEVNVKQKNNILSLIVNKQIDFIKNSSGSKSSAILPETPSVSNKSKEILTGFKIESSLSVKRLPLLFRIINKLKTTSLSNNNSSVHFDSNIKRLKTKLHEAKHKSSFPELDFSYVKF